MADPRAIACPYEDCRAAPGDPCRNNQGDPVRSHADRVAASQRRTRLQVIEDRLDRIEGILSRKDLL